MIQTDTSELKISRKGRLQVDLYDRATGNKLCGGVGVFYDPSYSPLEDPSYKTSKKKLEPPSGYKIRSVKASPLGEAYLGLGDWAGPVNRRSATLQFWNEDAWGWGEFRNPKYTTLPIYHAISPTAPYHRYSLFLNNPSRSLFDMSSQKPDQLWFQVSTGILDYFLIAGCGDSLDLAMRSLSELTGFPALLPKWGYGYHMSKFTYTEKEIDTLVTAHQALRVPLSAVFIDMDYMDQTPSVNDREWELIQFKWGPAYPTPARLISSLWDMGIGTVVMVEPFVTDEDPKFTEAESSGWFVRRPDGTPCLHDIWCAERIGWIDYTAPGARQWWSWRLSDFLKEYGPAGIWNDLNETADKGRIPLDAIYAMGQDIPPRPRPKDISGVPWERRHAYVKSLYSIFNARTSYENLKFVKPFRRPYVLSRGAFPGLQRYAASWSGDNVASEDHLRCNIRSGTSVGISGLSNFGHDVGGFSGSPTPEVMERWQEWAVFSPSMRNHYSKESDAREIYKFPPENATRLEGTVLQRYYILPLLYSLAYQASHSGWPINAPVPAVFPGELATYSKNENDIMVGQDMLVAPVVEVNSTTRTVHLPEVEGGWFSFWGDERYTPGHCSIPAPLGRAPAFVRAGAIVPVYPRALSPERVWGREATEWDQVEIHAWPGAHGYFEYFDDDGVTSLDHPTTSRVRVQIGSQPAGRGWVITLRSDQPLGKRRITLILRGLKSPPRDILVHRPGSPPTRHSGVRIDIPQSPNPLSVVVEVPRIQPLDPTD